MASPPRPRHILNINTAGSDGDGRKWPKHTLVRNDQYYLEKLGEMWSKDLPNEPQPGVNYELDRLPTGYAGFEKTRPDSKHVDRYIYGHQRGQFRSLNEFYPHFKHLMEYGNAYGCGCKQCATRGDGKTAVSKTRKAASSSASAARPIRQVAQPIERSESQPKPLKRKLVDMEGTPDVYEVFIDKLKAAGPEQELDEPVDERLSPDWRTGNHMSKSLLATWRELPRFVPRIGEVVMFIRKINRDQIIAWNYEEGMYFCFSPNKREWLDAPVWEAGVVTQMPEGQISEQDLLSEPESYNNVVAAGFRIEPLPGIGGAQKSRSKQYTYVPLRMIRPFSLWSECLTDDQTEWHPTIKHALTITNSISLIGRYRFKGRWPHATVFCRGVYIGQELIMVGDTVKLLPRPSEPDPEVATDIMVITAIRFRFVNLDIEETGIATQPSDPPYQTCLHLSGRVFTLDPKRSFDGNSETPIDPESDVLPTGVSDYGKWYHYQDPAQPSLRVELPFHRIFTRCPTDAATRIWFRDITDSNPERSVRAGGSAVAQSDEPSFQQGFEGATPAHTFSLAKDTRIKSGEGKSWFWADTRIEQLDLHEVNSRSVGAQDEKRTDEQMAKWRASLKALEGKAGGVAGYKAANMLKEVEAPKAASPYSMMATSGQAQAEPAMESSPGADNDGPEDNEPGSIQETDDDVDHLDDMELDEPQATPKQPMGMMVRAGAGGIHDNVVELDSSEEEEDSGDSDDSETNGLAAQLAKNIRTG